ncbi:MAG: transporter [Dyella sp.]|nr:transporter [Dyella sp.]
MLFGQHYQADDLKDNSGNNVPVPGFKVKATAIAPRFIWITNETVAGASLGMHVILPLVTLDVKAAGASQSKTGFGDMAFGPVLGWHFSPKLHAIAGLDVFAPTGSYTKGDLANIGRNYWAIQPLVGVSYIDPAGLNADIKLMYTFNTRNNATDYLSGQELIVDYALGWGLGHGWVLGVGGYAYQQTTDDKQGGATVPDNKGRAFAIGPSIKYDSGKGWFVTAKYQMETGVRNRAEGQTFWLKAVVPF